MARLNWTLWLFATIVGVISSDITNGNSSIATYQRMMKLRHLAVEFFDFYENVTVTDLKPRIPTEQDLLCAAEVQQLGQALQSGSLWALRMIDSWGGLPSGLLHGNLKDLGNFDECIRIQHEMTTTGHLLRGKYCSAKLPVGSVLGGNSPALSTISAQTAVCFPASCSAENIDALLGQLLQQLLNIELNTQLINEANCQTAEKEPLDGLAIFTIVLLSILAGLMLLTTIWDYFFCHDQKRLPAVVQIFSARVNSRALFRFSDSKSNPNVIDCLHGIRGLSLMWVIYGHDYLMAAVSPIINLVDIVPWFKSPYSMFTIHALFSVDTFFFLSGLLIVLVALRTMEKTRGKLNVPLMYLHRFLRLTPVLALGILGYMAILPVIGGGPVYNTIILAQKANCEESWFWTLLYVQNYVAAETMCLGHSWYLGVDTQLYVISPLLLLALYKWGKKAVAGIVVFMLLLAACLFSMMMVRGYTLQLMVDSNKIYYTTHTRASPWIIGLLFGYFLHVNRGKSFKLKPLAVWAGWIFSLALIFACLFGIYPYAANGYELPKLNEAFYVTLTRIAWPIALIWVVFACKYGYGGLANSFLSSPLWQPLSKLSYCAYIWHFFILELNGFSTHTSTYFSDYQVMLRFWPDFGFTILLAYVMYILVEAPTGGIQTLLLPSGRPKASPPKADAPTIEPRVNEGDTQAAPPVALKTPLDG